MFREIYKLEPKHFEGYRRTNFTTDIRSTDTKNIVYKLTPVGIGRLTSIRQKGETIFGQAFVETNKTGVFQCHPLFRFLIKRFVLYIAMLFNPQKTKIRGRVVKEVVMDLRDKRKEQSAHKVIDAVIQEVFRGDKYVPEYKEKPNRLEKLKSFTKLIDNEVQKTIQDTLQFIERNKNRYIIPDNHKCLVTYRKYVLQQVNLLKIIEPLTTLQQYQKYDRFSKQHVEVFQSGLGNDKSTLNFYFRVARISNEPQPVLQRLSEFVELRFEDEKYHQESANFMKDLYSQLNKYQKLVSKICNRRVRYSDLTPDSVIMDQFALLPKLHYQPIMMEAIGLKYRPLTTQLRIAFNPTPKGVNYFKSPIEFKQQTQYKLRDPHFGCSQIYGNELKYLMQDNLDQIELQKNELDQIKEEMITWRFLLVSYFINKGKEFGRKEKPLSTTDAQNYLLTELQSKQKKLSRNAAEIEEFLGIGNYKAEGGSFSFKFQDLGDYMMIYNDDSTIKRYNFERIIRYHNLRWTLAREVANLATATITNSGIFYKVINVKKYILAFLIYSNEVFYEAKRLILCERQRAGERQQMRLAIDNGSKKIKKINDYISTLFERISSYRNRQGSDSGAKYLNQRSGYIINLLEEINNNLLQLAKLTEDMNSFEVRDDPNRKQFKETMKKTQTLVDTVLPKTQDLVREFTLYQFDLKSRQDSLHKPPDQKQFTRDAYNLITQRLVIVVITYLRLNQTNYPSYDSLIVPLLNIPENVVMIPESREEVTRMKEEYSSIQEFIDCKQIMQLPLKYFNKGQSGTPNPDPGKKKILIHHIERNETQ